MSEQLVMEISAMLDGAGGLGNGKLRLTTERLVFERRKMLGRGAGDVTAFPLSTIQSAQVKGLVTKSLTVRAGSTTLKFTEGLTDSSGAKLQAIADLLQQVIAGTPLRVPGSPAPADAQATPPAPGPALIDELERLAALHVSGALTDGEFADAKRLLLRPS